MAAGEVHVGDIGTIFRLTIKDGADIVDVSGASAREIIFRKPGADRLVKTSVFPSGGDGTDGQIEYKSKAGDLNEDGLWQWQGKLTWVSGDLWYTDVANFEVFENI